MSNHTGPALRARSLLSALAVSAALPALAQTAPSQPTSIKSDSAQTGSAETSLASLQSQWTSRAPLPIGVGEVGVAELDGQVYVVGGTRQVAEGEFDLEWSSTQIFAYDPSMDTWNERGPLPHALTHVAVAVLDGRLYAIGGFTDLVHMNAQSAVHAYDPATDTWSALPPLPVALGSVAVAGAGGRLHVLGGRDSLEVVDVPVPPGMAPVQAGLGTVDAHLIFDPNKGLWIEGAPVPGPTRDHAGVAVLNGRIHLFGGRVEGYDENLDRHDVYDPATDTWSVAAPLPTPRSAGAATVLDGLILYAGGECKPGGEPFSPNAFDDLTAYDPVTDSWSALAPLPRGGRHGFGAATVDGVAFFAGGAPVCGGGATTDMLALTTE